MKPENHDNEDRPLGRLLQEWQVKEPLPPRFQEQVWRRIEAAERPTRSLRCNWLKALLARPALASALAAVLLLAGPAAGYWRANHEVARLNTELAQRYVASVDPYAHQGF